MWKDIAALLRLSVKISKLILLHCATPNPAMFCMAKPGIRIPALQRKKLQIKRSRAFFMAGVEGFEPPNASTKNWCLTTWRHPKAGIIIAQYGVSSLVACEDRRE